MKRMIKCLQNFKNFDENDVKDKKWEKWLNELIERARKERNTHDVWGSIKKNYKSIISSGVTFLANIVGSKCLSKFNIDWLSIVIIIMALCDLWLIYVIFSLFRGFLCDFVIPSKKQILDSFISDVEDIKLFPKIVRSMNRE